jgi:endonuclease YncB( thermonuclease family)
MRQLFPAIATLTVLKENKQPVKIRLAEIDAGKK